MQRCLSLKSSIMTSCWSYFRRRRHYWRVADIELEDPPNMKSKDIPNHPTGYLSMACIQSNVSMEDFSSVEIEPLGTFVGIYDGHGGPDAASYVCNHLYRYILEEIQRDQGNMSEQVLKNAFHAMEEDFMQHVFSLESAQDNLLTSGSCCLVGFICNQKLYLANLGDSRAVLGRSTRRECKGSVAVQLTSDHNAREDNVRRQLMAMHPGDSSIVEKVHGVWRVKGIIQVSRSIGDAYLKRPSDVDQRLLPPRFVTKEKLSTSVLIAVPETTTQRIESGDQFVIFASDGLWDHLTNQEAVHIVETNTREGIAKRLIKAALYLACKNNSIIEYSDLENLTLGKLRRSVHDDISVVVVFLDHQPLNIVDRISLRDGVLIGPSTSNSDYSIDENVASTEQNEPPIEENIASIE